MISIAIGKVCRNFRTALGVTFPLHQHEILVNENSSKYHTDPILCCLRRLRTATKDTAHRINFWVGGQCSSNRMEGCIEKSNTLCPILATSLLTKYLWDTIKQFLPLCSVAEGSQYSLIWFAYHLGVLMSTIFHFSWNFIFHPFLIFCVKLICSLWKPPDLLVEPSSPRRNFAKHLLWSNKYLANNDSLLT